MMFTVLDKPITKIRNMTYHDVIIRNESGNIIKLFPPDPEGAIRVYADFVELDDIFCMFQFRGVNFMPEMEPGTALIVSREVKLAFRDRYDLVVPSRLIKDDNGEIVGCKGLNI